MRTKPTSLRQGFGGQAWRKIRPTRLHGFNRDRTEARYREGNLDWVCIKTRKGWFRTDEYEYAN